MKVFIPILALLGVVAATPELHAKWSAFKATHGKDYASHIEPVRLKAFAENVRLIEEHNAKFERGEVSYELGLNEHSDLTDEEFSKDKFGLAISEEYRASVNVSKHVSMPGANYVDWSREGRVTEVRRQGCCGSCYAFLATSLFESYQISKDEYEGELSVQDIIDCTYRKMILMNAGCNGGDLLFTLNHSISHGLALDLQYDYRSRMTNLPETCRSNVRRLDLSRFTVVEVNNNEDEFANALQYGPLAVAVNGENRHFKNYKRGVYDYGGCTTKVNHGMLLVGYGKDRWGEYWKLKNSWGTSWGEFGYMRMVKGMNQCGIGTRNAYYLR